VAQTTEVRTGSAPNRPGAAGNIGSDLVAKSVPDGYTLLMGTVGTHAINPSLYSKMPYDHVKDFAPVVLVAGVPNVLVVNPALPVNSVSDLIKLAKDKPGQINFASSGSGTSIHLSGELFKTMAGVDMTHVPYKGSSPALTDLIGGQVQVMFDNLPSALPQIKGGKLRAIAVTSLKEPRCRPTSRPSTKAIPVEASSVLHCPPVPAGSHRASTPRSIKQKRWMPAKNWRTGLKPRWSPSSSQRIRARVKMGQGGKASRSIDSRARSAADSGRA
jgi:hypothetical protein